MSADERNEAQQPSKSQRKREALAQQQLGERLANLAPATLEKLNLPEQLDTALSQFQRLPNSRGARRRQLQYIGKLMREIDCDAIEAELATHTSLSKAEAGPQTPIDLNEVCDQILTQGDSAITEFVSQYSQLERQKLRQLQRSHRQAAANKAESIRKRLMTYLSEELLD